MSKSFLRYVRDIPKSGRMCWEDHSLPGTNRRKSLGQCTHPQTDSPPRRQHKYPIPCLNVPHLPTLFSFRPVRYSLQLPDPQQHPIVRHAPTSGPQRHLCDLVVYHSWHGGVPYSSSEHRYSEPSGVRVTRDAQRVGTVRHSRRRSSLQYISFVSLRYAYYQQWCVHLTFSL